MIVYSFIGFALELRVGRVEVWDVFHHLLASFVGGVEFLIGAAGIAYSDQVFVSDFKGALRVLAFGAKNVFYDKPNF